MLAIRLQRTGRSGHAQFRLIVQDSHVSPKSGKVVARLGSYNPHTKQATLDKEKASFYLKHGAQPSHRIASLLKKEGIKLPKWVASVPVKHGQIRNPEKLHKDRPVETITTAEPVAEPTVEESPKQAEATEVVETETDEPSTALLQTNDDTADDSTLQETSGPKF
ncbi:30S ribosomal protein S16 [Candidatus Saccharibacteria bacterium]|nr:30S ribosomal protein S16 [Candidatus Saccharibacteria bacterium]